MKYLQIYIIEIKAKYAVLLIFKHPVIPAFQMKNDYIKKLKKNFDLYRKSYRSFITKVDINTPATLDVLMEETEK